MNQFLRCIPDKTWLFKYGRVPLNLIMGEWVWQVSHFTFIRTVTFHSFRCSRLSARSFVSSFLHWGGRCDSGLMTRVYIHPPNLPHTRPIVPLLVPTSYPCLVRPVLFDLNRVRYVTTPSAHVFGRVYRLGGVLVVLGSADGVTNGIPYLSFSTARTHTCDPRGSL